MSQKDPQTMEELLASQEGKAFAPLKRRQVVQATILKISPREILLDLGGKAEGVVSGKEIDQESLNRLKEGDNIPVTILQTDSDNDYILCSMQVLADTRKLSGLQEALESEEPVEVKVVEERKGGFLVNYNTMRGFLPASQVSLDYVGKTKDLIGQNIQVKVIEFDAEAPRLIVSQKAVVSEKAQEARKNFYENTTVGDTVNGTVAAVLPFGIVVNLNGIEGFVHISEIAWERVENTNNYFKVGDPVKAIVTGINESDGKITLSVKQLLDSPWQALSESFAKKEQVKGSVTKPTSQGFLVRLENGIVGLIAKTSLADGQELADGTEVICDIESVDLEKKRVNLTLVK